MTPASPLFGAGLAAGQAAPEPQPGGGTYTKQKRSGYARDPYDWYVEPSWCSELLFREIKFDSAECGPPIWDPCCGMGTIPRVWNRLNGVSAHGTDIVLRDKWHSRALDFLRDPPDLPVNNIVCNPPYKLAEAFARRAIELDARKVAILVRLDFLASQKRHALFTEHPPAYVLVLSRRPSMPPGELLMKGEVRPTSGQHDFTWICWSKDHQGPTEMRWLK